MGKVSLKNGALQQSLRLDLAFKTTNLDTQKFYEESGFNPSMLDSLRNGEQLLTVEQAQKITASLKSQYIECSVSWLREGKGLPPYLLDHTRRAELSALIELEEQMQETIQKEFKTLKEIRGFYNLYVDARVCLVGGDGMAPFISPGDYLGGIKVKSNDFPTALNQICIVNTAEEHNMIRYLDQGSHSGTYTLSCLNPRTTEENPVLYNVEVESVAPVLWIRFGTQKKTNYTQSSHPQ